MSPTDMTLERLKRDFREAPLLSDGATVFVAVYDHDEDEIYHTTRSITNDRLARNNDIALTNMVLEDATRNLLIKWRGGGQ